MIIRDMTLGDLFLTELPAQFAVHLHAWASGELLLFLLKNPAQMMQKPCRRQEERRITEGVRMVKEKPCVDIFLFSRQSEPAYRCLPIPWNIMSHKIELAKYILRVLTALLRGCNQPFDSILHILGDILSQQIELSKLILGERIVLRCRFREELHRPGNVFRNILSRQI